MNRNPHGPSGTFIDPSASSRVGCDFGAVAAAYGNDAAKLLEILHEIQEKCCGIPLEALDELARRLHIPRTRIEAVATFYQFFRVGRRAVYEILFSDNIVDRHLGKDEIKQYLCERLWIEPGKLSEDGLVLIGDTSDIGLGDQGPAALVNGYALPALDKSRVDLIVELVRGRRPLEEWPRMLFEVPDNVRRAGPLLGSSFRPGAALCASYAKSPESLLGELRLAKLRGRGGAGYPTASKWASCRKAPASARYVVCNADEGEPGTFKDRVLLASHADLVFEGMTLCARTIGAREGILYLRGEYRHLLASLEAVLERRRAQGLLGECILGEQGFDFDITVRRGAGAYICGEESALIESLEGKPGRPRNRPPFPDTCGYLGEPTVVNNVETFACACQIALNGGEWFASLGTETSAGSKLLSVSGDCARPGIYEVPFGVTVREVLADCGALKPLAVQVSGPSGTCISWKEFDRRIGFEDLPTAGAFMIFSRERDMFEVARNFTHFFAHESCGFCTPCRVGTGLLKNTMDKLAAGKGSAYDMEEIRRIMHVLLSMSHCGLGHTAANPVVQTMEKFPEAYERRLHSLDFEPAFDLDGALAEARRITGRDDAWAHIEN